MPLRPGEPPQRLLAIPNTPGFKGSRKQQRQTNQSHDVANKALPLVFEAMWRHGYSTNRACHHVAARFQLNQKYLRSLLQRFETGEARTWRQRHSPFALNPQIRWYKLQLQAKPPVSPGLQQSLGHELARLQATVPGISAHAACQQVAKAWNLSFTTVHIAWKRHQLEALQPPTKPGLFAGL
jgi:hypothetical protein